MRGLEHHDLDAFVALRIVDQRGALAFLLEHGHSPDFPTLHASLRRILEKDPVIESSFALKDLRSRLAEVLLAHSEALAADRLREIERQFGASAPGESSASSPA